MDFDQLHTFLEIVRLNSFSKAAKTCFRTQPAISAQIRQMEMELETLLFERFGSRITLTPAGHIFANYARKILDLRKQGIDEVRELERIPKGEMTIAANEATCVHVLPAVFSRYRKKFNEVQIQVVRAYGANTINAVLDNSVDFGVTQLPVLDKKIEAVQIFSDEICLMTSPRHHFANKKSVTAAEIANEDLLMPKGGHTRSRINEYLNVRERDLRISMELESSEMMKRFTEADMGITFMALTHAQEEIRKGKLCAIRLHPLPMIRTIGLIYRKDKMLSRAAIGFIQIITEFATETNMGLPTTNKTS